MRSSSAVRSESERGPLSSQASSWIPNFAPEAAPAVGVTKPATATTTAARVAHLSSVISRSARGGVRRLSISYACRTPPRHPGRAGRQAIRRARTGVPELLLAVHGRGSRRGSAVRARAGQAARHHASGERSIDVVARARVEANVLGHVLEGLPVAADRVEVADRAVAPVGDERLPARLLARTPSQGPAQRPRAAQTHHMRHAGTRKPCVSTSPEHPLRCERPTPLLDAKNAPR